MKNRAFIFGIAVVAMFVVAAGLWHRYGQRYKADVADFRFTNPPAVDPKIAVVLSPDAHTDNVTDDEVRFVLKAIAQQTRRSVDGPVIGVSKGPLNGKEQIIAATRLTMFFFVHDESGSWKLESCGYYHYH